MQVSFGLSRKSLVAFAGLAAGGVSLACLLAGSASAQLETSRIDSALKDGQSIQQTDQYKPLAKVRCRRKGQTFTFPIVTDDAPGVISPTWSVVPPVGVASVAGTNPNPAWVTPPAGIFWEQAVNPPAPVNPIIEQAGAMPFKFKAHFGPLPPLAQLASITLAGSFSVDNDGAVYLNVANLAHQVGFCAPTFGPPPVGYGAKCFTTTFPLASVITDYVAGMNSVIVDVHNNELISGFMIDATVTAVCK